MTLVGTGGVGKTRLALEVASGLVDRVADGVRLVELAALREAAYVARAVAVALDIQEQPGRSLTAALTAAIGTRELVLVLDNCEQLIDACATLANDLLRACPGLRILATSRQPLDMAGETTFRVPSLGLAPCVRQDGSFLRCDIGRGVCIDHTEGPGTELVVSEAVQLFAERARTALPSFTLDADNLAAVETISRRLDGIPLAIELAAVRVQVLSPEQIAARLDDRFRLLTAGSRSVLPRYRTLRSTIDWSYDLLDLREQVLLRRLAVFAGGWSLEAAEDVASGDGLERDEILDLLAALVAKSLVLPVERADGVRYRFLESIRDYALERLRAADEETTLRARHAAWYVSLAEEAGPQLVGPHQDAWLDRLACERENLRLAQRWMVSRGEGETLARLGAALWQYWWARGDANEARETIEAMLQFAHVCPPSRSLACGLRGIGVLAGTVGDYETCRKLLGQGLAVARQLDEPHTLATVLDSIGRQSFIEGRYAEARPSLDEAVAIFRKIGDGQALARALSHLGFLEYLEGRQESARAIYREGLDFARQAGDSGGAAEFLDNLGRTYQADGDYDRAIQSYLEAAAIWRETGQGPWLAMVLNNLGSVQTARGELEKARVSLAEALVLSRTMGNRRRLAFTLAAVASLAAIEGEPDRAVRLDAVSSLAISQLGASLAQPMFAQHFRAIEQARHRLGRAADALAATGRATALDRVVEETLRWLDRDRVPPQEAPLPATRQPAPAATEAPVLTVVAPAPRPSPLSRRELEVVRLIAQGMTNRQIANELVITEGTAANHVKHILARLALNSRVQVAAWAVEQGLYRRPAS